ncbi:ABC transporter permease family protein [Isoptericola aurantiacus]|uniref:hypothetical protein n=1 Tax=Isoptericola aurantiacus TaxID=3377839 RepID=UPI003839CFF9
MGIALRRAWARRGLLTLVALLVAATAATSTLMLAGVAAATTDAARRALAEPAPASLTVTTRLAEDPDAQDARARAVADDLFDGAPIDVVRTQEPDGADTPFVVWTVTPQLDVVTPADLGPLAAGSAALRQALREDDVAVSRGVTVEGDLAERAAVEHTAQSAARAAGAVPLALLILVALVALVQVARLLAGARQGEVEILVARGASVRHLTVPALTEAVAVAVLAAAAGTAAVAAVPAVWETPPSPLLAAGVGTVAAAVVVLTAVAVVQARSVADRQASDRSGRLRQAAALGTVTTVVALAAAGMLRWYDLGSPLVRSADGVAADPLAAAGPALALAALGLLAVALLGPLARGWAALAGRAPGATPVLAARQVARGLRVVVVPLLLLVLASGSAVLAGTFAGTAAQARADLAGQRVGTDVRALLPASGSLSAQRPPPRAAGLAGLDGADAAAPALVAEATVQGAPLGLTALPVASAPQVVRADDAASLVAPLGDPDPFGAAPALPDGATSLALDVTGAARPAAGPLPDGRDPGAVVAAVTVWLAAQDGTLTVLDAGTVELDGDPGDDRLTVDLPSGVPGLRLVGLDVGLEGVESPMELTLAVQDVVATTAGGAVPVDVTSVGWEPAGPAAAAGAEGGAVLGLDVLLDTGRASARLVAGSAAGSGARAAAGAAGPPVAGVLTRSAAERWDATTGDTLELTLSGASVVVEVAGTAEQVPGQPAADAVLVDLGALDAALLRTTEDLPRPAEVWVASDAPDDPVAVARLADAVATAVRAQAPDPAAVEVRTVQDAAGSDAGSPVRFAFLLAAVGATALALVGLAAVAVSGMGGRRAEVVVLRSVGLGARAQGAGRALELGAVGAAGLAGGVIAGWAVAAVTVPGLVRGVVDGTVVPDLVLDLPVAAFPVAVAALAVIVTAGLVAARVADQARDTDYRPETR